MLFRKEGSYLIEKMFDDENVEDQAAEMVLGDLGLEVARQMAKVQTVTSKNSIEVRAELHAYSHEQMVKIKKYLTHASIQNESKYVSEFATMLLKELELL